MNWLVICKHVREDTVKSAEKNHRESYNRKKNCEN